MAIHHTVLPATRHRWTCPTWTPAWCTCVGWYSIYLRCRIEGWVIKRGMELKGAARWERKEWKKERHRGGSLEPPLQSFNYVIWHLVYTIELQVELTHWWLGGITVRTLDSWSNCHWFNSWSGRYQVVTTWMGDCLWAGKPSRYITNTKVNSAFHPSGVGKSSTGLHGSG